MMKVLRWLLYLAFGLFLGYSTTSLVWRWIEPQPRSTFTFPGVVRDFCQFHPSGKTLALRTYLRYPKSHAQDNQVWCFVNVESGRQESIHRLETDIWFSEPTPILVPSGKLVFVEWGDIDRHVTENGEIRTRSGHVVTSLEGTESKVKFELPEGVDHSLPRNGISPDGRWLVLPPCELPDDDVPPMTDDDEPISPPLFPQLGRLVSLESEDDGNNLPREIWFECGIKRFGKVSFLYEVPPVAFSSDGNLVALSIPTLTSEQRTDRIQVWDLRERSLRYTISDGRGSIQSLWFERGSQTLVASGFYPTSSANSVAASRLFDGQTIRYDGPSGRRISSAPITDPITDKPTHEADGWRITFCRSNSFPNPAQSSYHFAVIDPDERQTCTLKATSSQAPTVSRFIPGTNLIEHSFYRDSFPRFPWLWGQITRLVPALKATDRVNEGELQIIDRRNGTSLWKSHWSYTEEGNEYGPSGQWYFNPHPHAVSADGKWLAEGTTDGYSTTFRFWELPQRRWPGRIANGLGVLVAVFYWGVRRGPRSSASSAPLGSPPIADTTPVVDS